MCQVDILLVIQDNEMRKLIEYNSGVKEKGLYTLERALQAFEEVKKKTKRYQQITDDIYDRYVNGKKTRDFEVDDESQVTLEQPESLKVPRISEPENRSITMPVGSEISLEALGRAIEQLQTASYASPQDLPLLQMPGHEASMQVHSHR